MGVTELWSILSPVRESVPLYSLTGKTLAVDLSLWVCEAQHVQAMMGKVTKPHLRNLFFRASSLLRMGVKLVFVMEGEAPKIKAETMSKRTEMAFGGSKTKSVQKSATVKNTDRGRFKAVLSECAELLDCLGIPWVTAVGEAEAMCAFLDAQGLVDGCITSDGDAFLYGAQTVYRNFNMNTKDPQIDCYKMSRVETELQLKRETLVGLAVLLGCDYIPKGVAGVGKEQTLKLISNLNGQTLLQKFSEWKRAGPVTLRTVPKKVSHCLVCRHPGSAKSHEHSGCEFCDSKQFCQPQDYDSRCPCDWHRQGSSVESNIKKKALACEKFPFTEIITEFLVSKDKVVCGFKRRKPNLLLMQNFALDKMEWPKHYTSKKVLALMTYTELMNRNYGSETSAQTLPIRILKRRVKNGISCFEVLWSKPDHYVFPEGSLPEELDVVRTVEEENLFSIAFPNLVKLFSEEKAEANDNKSKTGKKPKAKKDQPADSLDMISSVFAQLSLRTSTALEPSEAVSSSIMPLDSKTGLNPTVTLDIQPEVLPSPCPTGIYSKSQSSPSVSAVLDELQLSSIDWDALSFTSSPSSQPSCSVVDLKPEIKVDEKANATGGGIMSEDFFLECLLTEGVSKRSVTKSAGSMNIIECSAKAKVQSTGSELKNADLSQGFVPSKNLKAFLHCKGKKNGQIGSTAQALKEKTASAEMQQLPRQVRPNFNFPKPKHSLIALVLPERNDFDPSYKRLSSDLVQTKQRSVCKSVCINQVSSSEESDTENCPGKQIVFTPHQRTEQDQINISPIKEQLSIVHPKSLSDSDTDDSDVVVESPLPLAERLKLKFKK